MTKPEPRVAAVVVSYESRETLDEFVRAMAEIAREAASDPDLLHDAPHDTRVTRLDETRAARRPVLRWRPGGRPSRP